MPTLDSCIGSIYEPGNIGSSPGTPPTVITPGSLETPADYDPDSVIYSLDYSKFYNSMYLLLLMVGGGDTATVPGTTPEPPAPDADPGVWPSISNTGYLTTPLTPAVGNYNSSSNGQTISAIDCAGTIVVTHSDVTVVNCRAYGLWTEDTTNTTFSYCTVIGGASNSGINLIRSDGSIVSRCNVGNVENGIWCESDNVQILDNYIHGAAATDTTHIDGLQIPGGPNVSNVTIRHNNFDLPEVTTSSCVTMSSATNIDLDNNRLDGGSYSVYFEAATTLCDVTNNWFGSHAFGYVNGTAYLTQTYSGNKLLDSTPLSLP